jgi:hypothetical protein
VQRKPSSGGVGDDASAFTHQTVGRKPISDARTAAYAILYTGSIPTYLHCYPFVDTYRCAKNGQRPYLPSIRPDGHEMS